MFQKTRSMLALSYGGIIAIILIIVALAYYLLLSHTLKNNVSTQLKQVFTQVSGQLEGVSLKTGLSIPELLQLTYPKTVAFNWGFLELDEFCIMVDSSGQLLTSSYKQSTNGSIPTEDILAWSKTDISSGGLNALTDHHTPEGRDFTTMLVPLDKSTVDYGYLFTGKEVTSNQYVLNQMRMIMIILGAGLLVIASGIGYVFAGRAMIPIRQAYKRQQEFSADASHELRTPLAVLHSSVEVIGEYRDRLPPFQQDVLQKMEEEISRMTQLVEGLLTLSRSDSEYPQLLLEPFELRAIVAEAVEMMRPLALGAGVRLYFEDKLAAGASSSFHGDKARVKQLVIILLDNALKYNRQEGTVMIRLEAGGSEGWKLTVSDTGTGIPADELPLIFERFYRADKVRSRSTGGMGLGLSIAAWIAKAHGGRITAESEYGKGSRFTVILPG